MSSNKCKYCGLTNFPDAFSCKRCGMHLGYSPKNAKRRRGPSKYSIVSLLIFAGLMILAYYMVGGFEQSMERIDASEANRMATQPKQQDAGLSRTQYDQKRAGTYGTAVQNSNSFAENQKHNDEIQKAMNASQGSTQR